MPVTSACLYICFKVFILCGAGSSGLKIRCQWGYTCFLVEAPPFTWALEGQMGNVLKCRNCNLRTGRENTVWESLKDYYRRFIFGLETWLNIMKIFSAQCLWKGKYCFCRGSSRGAMNFSAKWGVPGLTGVVSVLTKKPQPWIVHLLKASTRRSLNSVIEPDYQGWIISGKGSIPG